MRSGPQRNILYPKPWKRLQKRGMKRVRCIWSIWNSILRNVPLKWPLYGMGSVSLAQYGHYWRILWFNVWDIFFLSFSIFFAADPCFKSCGYSIFLASKLTFIEENRRLERVTLEIIWACVNNCIFPLERSLAKGSWHLISRMRGEVIICTSLQMSSYACKTTCFITKPYL